MIAYLSVALGGATGAVLRFLVSQLLPQAKTGFPYATLLVNIVGCILIGVFYVFFVERYSGTAPWRELLVVGLCGGFTTYSAFSFEVLQLWQSGQVQTALIYIVLSVVFCIVATLVAVSLMRLV